MLEMIKQPESRNEDIKQKMRDRIAELERNIERDRQDLTELRRSLSVMEGTGDINPAGIFRGVSSIDAIIVYLNQAGIPVNEEQMIKDLVREGAGFGKAVARGGAEGVIRKSITQFLKTGRGSEPTPLLTRSGAEDDPKRTISLSASS